MKKPRKFIKRSKEILSVKNNFKETFKPFKFPNISRIFPVLLWSWVTFILFLIVILAGVDFYQNYKKNEELLIQREETLERINYWQGVVLKYKDYRDGYFQLAVLEYNLQNFEKAKAHLQKVFELDPNFEEGRELEKLLQ